MTEFKTPPDLQAGSTGEDVDLLQQFLIVLNLMPGPQPSGVLDEETATTVASFKAENGLPEDGNVDGNTWAALFAAVGPTPVDPMPTFPMNDYPAFAQLYAFGQAGEGSVDIEGYIAASLDVA